MPRDIYLVGSVPLANARAVFETVSAVLGPRLKRIPDGETGERINWVFWQEALFAGHPAFERSDRDFQLHATSGLSRRYRLQPGISLRDVQFDNLFYADVAIGSYRTFAALKAEGKIAPDVKFQVDLVPAHSVIWLFVEDDLHAAIDPIYNAAVKREIDKLAAAIPHDQLAIQLDVASAVFARLERRDISSYGATKEEMFATFSGILLDLGSHVPDGIELLYHFCYGDAGHRHVVEPTDMGDMVELANRLAAGIGRNIDLVHMPVPRDRSDNAYFEPLKQLKLRPETELCLGLVHYTDGIEGTRKRMAAAEKFVRDFSIGTECGFGRRDPATIPELLRIHAEAAA
ncbi:MAG: hypothetical protein AB7T18_19325 [Alphaproteobacteria bacterium]